jgi:anti-sigma B factor antagonist
MVARRLSSVAVDVAFDALPDISYPVREVGGCSVVAAGGELDLWTCPALRKALHVAAESSRRLVIDLTAVTFLDSSGIGVLLDAHVQRRHRAPVVLVGAVGMVRRVLEVSGVSGEFHFCSSVDEATAALA